MVPDMSSSSSFFPTTSNAAAATTTATLASSLNNVSAATLVDDLNNVPKPPVKLITLKNVEKNKCYMIISFAHKMGKYRSMLQAEIKLKAEDPNTVMVILPRRYQNICDTNCTSNYQRKF